VEIEVENIDKGGTFLGSIYTVGAKPINLGHALVKQVSVLGGRAPP
jgi:hypothetical protein